MSNPRKVVLAYSGGLDTSVILKWLINTYHCDVITMTANLGQPEDLSGVEEKAYKTGAKKAYVLDLREEMARDFVFPMVRSAAIYENRYLLGTSIARPLISKALVEIAHKEGADAIAHGATGKGNDQVRFELSAKALDPSIRVIAPWREWDLMSRTALNAFAEANGIPISKGAKRYSMDANMLHTSFEGSELEDPGLAPDPVCHERCVPMEQAPDTPEEITVDFEKGNPVAFNGKRLSPYEIIHALELAGGRNGVGRSDIVENRYVGMKCRGVYETPGGTILMEAHQQLEELILDRDTYAEKIDMGNKMAQIVYEGKWFTPLREAVQAFVEKTQEYVTGEVKFKLYKGNIIKAGTTSPYSLYNESLASFTTGDLYDHHDAEGFINLFGLSSKVRAMKMQEVEKDNN